MTSTTRRGRRPAVQITAGRAARLHRLVLLLAERPRTRDELLRALRIGLRTFYRELELLRRCGVRIKLSRKDYQLQGAIEAAEALLPFPDPRLSFAEMRELSAGDGPAARRLAELLAQVLEQSAPPSGRSRSGGAKKGANGEAGTSKARRSGKAGR